MTAVSLAGIEGPSGASARTKRVPLGPEDQATYTRLIAQRAQFWRLYPRLIYDISMWDLFRVLVESGLPLLTANDEASRKAIAKVWAPKDPSSVIVTISIRTFTDLLLRAVKWPPQSEILMSAITIPHMVDVFNHNKIVPTAFDIDLITFEADLVQFERNITPRTKAVLVAPLFGRPIANVVQIRDICAKRGIMFILDGAQCFSIRDKVIDSLDSDVSTVSFGSIKFSTAFGGAVSTVKDPELRKRIQDLEAQLPTRPYATQLRNMFKLAFQVIIDDPISFGILRNALGLFGIHIGEFVNRLSRGFPGAELMPLLQYRPHPAMSALLNRRLHNVDHNLKRLRSVSAWHILSQLPNYVEVPSAGDPTKPLESTFWLFTLNIADPMALYNIMQCAGYDGALGTSQMRNVGQPGECPQAEQFMQHIFYFPLYPSIGEEERDKMVKLFHAIPRAIVQSPSKRFHEHVAKTPFKHAYRSKEVTALLKTRPQFTEAPSRLLSLVATPVLGYAVSKL